MITIEQLKDLLELWKRIVFNMAVTNTDDHLRNHAFILTDKGWILSPMFDVNPVSYGDELSLNVDESDNRISIELAVRTAVRFGIKESEAEKYAEEILTKVNVTENPANYTYKYYLTDEYGNIKYDETKPKLNFPVNKVLSKNNPKS